MRDLSKALIRFSWAMPLFGLQQMMNLFTPRDPNRSAEQTAQDLDAVSEAAAEQFGQWLKTMYKSGDSLQGQMMDGLFGSLFPGGAGSAGSARPPQASPPTPPYAGAPAQKVSYKADPQREIVIARYTKGSGRFSPDKKYIALRMKMFTLDGREDGYHEGVWEAQFKDPAELLARPASPEGPMNEPRGPVPHAPVMAHTKAHWVFGDNSSVSVAGPGASHLIPLPDGSFLFLVSTAQIITSGTGRFQGAYGLVQSLGSTHLPAGVNLFGKEDVSFTATTLDTFKIIPGRYYASLPPSQPARSTPPPQPSSGVPAQKVSYKADPQREIVIARYTKGSGRFSPDKKYIALRMKMFTLDGREDGYHEGVWEAQFKDPAELLARPASPEGPMNEPRGPVPHAPVMAHTKAHWVFGDNSSVSVAGPGASHLIPLPDGSFLFLVSTAQIITSGTGRFQGAYGLVQSLGSTHLPAGVNLFGKEDVSFTATTLDTFKIIPGSYYAALPAQSGSSTSTGNPPSPHYRFEPHFANVRGSRMHYIDEGSGDPILFLHGNPTWSYLWRNVIPHLTSSGRCIAPDLIGMGRSDKPQIEYSFFDQAKYLEAFIKHLNLRHITLVLHDWGSALGLHYAMRHQDNVKGLVLMEALLKPYDSWEDFPSSLRDTFRAFRDPQQGRDLIIEQNVMIEKVLQGSMLRPLSFTEMNYYREPFRTPSDRTPIWEFISELPIGGKPGAITSLVDRYSERLKRSDIPKLLIYAEPGAITTAPDVAWCFENLSNLTAVNIGPGIHFHQEDNPDGIGSHIRDWYETISSERRLK